LTIRADAFSANARITNIGELSDYCTFSPQIFPFTNMQITAAVARSPKAPLTIEQIDLEAPRLNEVLVRLVATGVCHTDIAMRDQAYPVPQPIVLGHEGSGIVVEVGAGVTKVKPGDHVVVTYNSCGHCGSCLENQPTYCHDFFGRNFGGSRVDGSTALTKGAEKIHGNFFGQSSFATYSICNERNIVKVRSDVPLELLGPLACGVQTGAGSIINALKVGTGKNLAIFGVGSVGLSAVMGARLAGAGTIIAVDVHEDRLKMALELGATHMINARNQSPIDHIMKITGSGVHYSLETTSLPDVIRQAVESLTLRGTCGILGASPVGTEVSLDVVHLMTAGRKIRGIVEGESVPELFVPRLIDLYLQGRFPFDKLIQFYPLNEINRAIDDSENGRAIKPVLRIGSV